MTKRAKPAPLTGLVKAKAKEGTVLIAEASTSSDDPQVALNFTVSRSFRRRFRRLAFDLDISQVELLKHAFAMLEDSQTRGRAS